MKQETIERLTLFNTGLLVVLICKVFLFSDSSVEYDGTVREQNQSTSPISKKIDYNSPPEKPPSSGGANNYEELLLQSIEPLERAYAEHGEDVLLPSEEQLQAAVKTNSLKSEESKVVLTILQQGYEKFNMPFPTLKIPSSRISTSLGPQQNDAPENALPPPFGEWLRQRADNLTKELKSKKESSAGLVPTEQEIQAAVSTGDPRSEESRLAIDILKNGYARLKLDFPEYGQAPTQAETEPSDSKSMRQKVSQQRILKAYFQGQVQRLKLEAAAQSKTVDEQLPSEESIESAVVSGSLKTEQSKTVIAQIEACYNHLGLTFYSPPTGD